MQGLRPLPRKYVETGHVQLHSDMCFKCFKMNQSFITCIKIINENRRETCYSIQPQQNNNKNKIYAKTLLYFQGIAYRATREK